MGWVFVVFREEKIMVDTLVAISSVLLYLLFGTSYYIRVVPRRYRARIAAHQKHQHYRNDCPCGKGYYDTKNLSRYGDEVPNEFKWNPTWGTRDHARAAKWVEEEKKIRFKNLEGWRDRRSQKEAVFQSIGLGLLWFPIFLLFLGKLLVSPIIGGARLINRKAFTPIEKEKILRRLEEDTKNEKL
jgi:hypothetical protein